MSNDRHIPIIDVSGLNDCDQRRREQLATEFFRAYSTVGFSYIVNHGVPKHLIDGVFSASRSFHASPKDLKLAVELDSLHRGFIPINTSTDVNSKIVDVVHPNQSESFMVMREDDSQSPEVIAGTYLAGPNQWPELEGFRENVVAYQTAMGELASKLIDVVSASLNADCSFTESFETPTTWLRLLYYPANQYESVEQSEKLGVYGSAPHTDFGCLTLLAQDEVGGLQVQERDGTWIDVPRIDNAFVVNVGDMLHRWSNGLLRSTPHRVINPSGRARYSCPFFYDPHVNTIVEPLPSCVSENNPARYESINFGEFLKAELAAGYEAHAEGQSIY